MNGQGIITNNSQCIFQLYQFTVSLKGLLIVNSTCTYILTLADDITLQWLSLSNPKRSLYKTIEILYTRLYKYRYYIVNNSISTVVPGVVCWHNGDLVQLSLQEFTW